MKRRSLVGSLFALGTGAIGWASTSVGGVRASEHVPEDAEPVDPGTTVEGTLADGEEHWFTIDLAAEDVLGVVFDSMFDDWTEKRVEISAYAPDGGVLDSAEIADAAGEGVFEPLPTAIGAPAPEAGTYGVRIASIAGEIPYSALIDVANEDTHEPNDDRASAAEITVGDAVDGVVVGDEEDWFGFEAEAGDGIELDLTAHDLAINRDIEMALFDPDGDEIGEMPRDQPFGAYSTRADLAFIGEFDLAIGGDVAEEDGTYHVRVRGARGRVHEGVRGFSAYTLVVETVDLDPYDPNERRETATPLTPGETIEAVAVGYDHDWYRFDAEEGGEIAVDYEVTQDVDLFNTERTLYDPGENVVYSSERSSEPPIVTAETAGTYYLHVGQSDTTTPAAFRNRLGYALTVRLNEEAPPVAGVTFTDQESDGTRIVIDEVTVPEGGFVAIYDERLITGEDLLEGIRGVSSFLDPGSHDRVEVALDDPITETQRLWAIVHRDTNDTREFVTSTGDEDEPYAGETTLVMDDACITIG